MGNSIGEKTLFTITKGRSIQVSADGSPKFKAGGVTIDWDYVPAAVVETTYEDNVIVPVGAKALRYGSVIYRLGSGKYGLATSAIGSSLKRGETYIINETWLEEDAMSDHPGAIDGGRVFRDRINVVAAASEVQLLTVTATGGTFTVIFRNSAGVIGSTGDIAYNASAATLQAALRAIGSIAAADVTVTKESANFVITFGTGLASKDVPQVEVDAQLATGGTVAVSTRTQGTDGTPTLVQVEAAMPGIVYALD